MPTSWWAGRLYDSPVARTLPTSCRVAGRRFFEPCGRPGPGRDGFGAPAGEPVFTCRFLNPLRTRAGVSLFGSVGFSQGLRVGGQRSGEPELGVGGDHEPGPPIGRFRAAAPGPGPPQGLLEQAECARHPDAPDSRPRPSLRPGRTYGKRLGQHTFWRPVAATSRRTAPCDGRRPHPRPARGRKLSPTSGTRSTRTARRSPRSCMTSVRASLRSASSSL